MKVAVLLGGIGDEREVSLVTGAACAKALREQGFDVVEIDPVPGVEFFNALQAAKPDVVFNALHGDWGEGGAVQTLLDTLGIPYTHSGAQASALAMHKSEAKRVLGQHGLTVAEERLLPRHEIGQGGAMPVPYVVKPDGSGSSASVYIVHEETSDLLAKIASDENLDPHALVERYIPGRELTVAVMDGRALTVTEIIPKGWYSYEEKYGEGAARHVLPADIPPAIAAICKDFAERAHHALGCSGLTRTDFRYDDTNLDVDNAGKTDMANRVVTLELNTQPGMTPTSLAPEQAAFVGLSFGELCRWIVEDALCRKQEKVSYG